MTDEKQKDPDDIGKQVVKTALGVAAGTLLGKFIAGLVRAVTACSKGGGS
ncbi:hypothetical protein P1X14_12305 [Sphingomonas sp. AOB5]|nr:hypothetical protein [Sphingomonas sp. AOB5]MDF7776032.1 hypothetical protein [Sphingomonas sp. AOB5]